MRKFLGIVVVAALMYAAYLYFDAPSTISAPPPTTSPEEVIAKPSTRASLSDVIPQAQPVWIEIRDILSKTALHPDGVYAGPTSVEPVDDQPVWWADSELPGTDSPGTTFILGHNYSGGDAVPFSALEQVRPGDIVSVGTEAGTLSYRVEQALKTPKSIFSDIAQLRSLKDPVAGRLVLMTCDTEAGRDTYDNFVVVAQLM